MRREQRLQASRRSQGDPAGAERETGSRREGVEQKSKRRSKQEEEEKGGPKVAEDSALLD